MGERLTMGDDARVPDQVAQAVYGRLGLNATHTVILGYRAPYALLVTATRPRDPYSIVSLDTGRTVERFQVAAAATARLADLTRSAGNASVGPADPAGRQRRGRDAP